MSVRMVYQQVRKLLEPHLDVKVNDSTCERIVLLVLGIIRAALRRHELHKLLGNLD